MKMRCSQPGKNYGFSIVELMVAVTIGLLLMAGAISIFISNKETYEVTEDLSRLQENARFAIGTMARDLRMTGFFGCADNLLAVTNQLTITTAGTLYDVSNPLEGYEQGAAGWAPSNNNENVAAMVADSDGITVRYAEGVGDALGAAMVDASDAVQIAAADTLRQGDIVAVNDCASADIVQVTGCSADANFNCTGSNLLHAASGTPGNGAATLSKVYDTDATVSRMVAARYFVGTGAAGGPSLFRTRFTANAGNSQVITEELVEGVENMQILYGVDTDGDRAPDAYRNAAAVTAGTDWPNVVTVRIGMLVRTVDEYGMDVDTATYAVNGFNFDPVDDRRRRRVFTTTLALRNLQ